MVKVSVTKLETVQTNLTIQTKLKIQTSKAAGFLIFSLLITFQAHGVYTVKGKIM